MAFIYKAEGGGRAYNSELANAGPDAMAAHQRQMDTLKLALAGSRDCRRLWADFASEAPELARLVVADLEYERRAGAQVSKALDKRLADAERLVTKSRKPKVTKARKRASAVPRDDRFAPAALLNSPDPAMREMARKALGG